MNSWENFRGSAINNEISKDKDFKKIKIKIAYIVNKELETWKNRFNIVDNPYGNWIYK